MAGPWILLELVAVTGASEVGGEHGAAEGFSQAPTSQVCSKVVPSCHVKRDFLSPKRVIVP